jgi:hypothetical protein
MEATVRVECRAEECCLLTKQALVILPSDERAFNKRLILVVCSGIVTAL